MIEINSESEQQNNQLEKIDKVDSQFQKKKLRLCLQNKNKLYSLLHLNQQNDENQSKLSSHKYQSNLSIQNNQKIQIQPTQQNKQIIKLRTYHQLVSQSSNQAIAIIQLVQKSNQNVHILRFELLTESSEQILTCELKLDDRNFLKSFKDEIKEQSIDKNKVKKSTIQKQNMKSLKYCNILYKLNKKQQKITKQQQTILYQEIQQNQQNQSNHNQLNYDNKLLELIQLKQTLQKQMNKTQQKLFKIIIKNLFYKNQVRNNNQNKQNHQKNYNYNVKNDSIKIQLQQSSKQASKGYKQHLNSLNLEDQIYENDFLTLKVIKTHDPTTKQPIKIGQLKFNQLLSYQQLEKNLQQQKNLNNFKLVLKKSSLTLKDYQKSIFIYQQYLYKQNNCYIELLSSQSNQTNNNNEQIYSNYYLQYRYEVDKTNKIYENFQKRKSKLTKKLALLFEEINVLIKNQSEGKGFKKVGGELIHSAQFNALFNQKNSKKLNLLKFSKKGRIRPPRTPIQQENTEQPNLQIIQKLTSNDKGKRYFTQQIPGTNQLDKQNQRRKIMRKVIQGNNTNTNQSQKNIDQNLSQQQIIQQEQPEVSYYESSMGQQQYQRGYEGDQLSNQFQVQELEEEYVGDEDGLIDLQGGQKGKRIALSDEKKKLFYSRANQRLNNQQVIEYNHRFRKSQKKKIYAKTQKEREQKQKEKLQRIRNLNVNIVTQLVKYSNTNQIQKNKLSHQNSNKNKIKQKDNLMLVKSLQKKINQKNQLNQQKANKKILSKQKVNQNEDDQKYQIKKQSINKNVTKKEKEKQKQKQRKNKDKDTKKSKKSKEIQSQISSAIKNYKSNSKLEKYTNQQNPFDNNNTEGSVNFIQGRQIIPISTKFDQSSKAYYNLSISGKAFYKIGGFGYQAMIFKTIFTPETNGLYGLRIRIIKTTKSCIMMGIMQQKMKQLIQSCIYKNYIDFRSFNNTSTINIQEVQIKRKQKMSVIKDNDEMIMYVDMDNREVLWEIRRKDKSKSDEMRWLARTKMPVETNDWRMIPFVGVFHKEDMVEVLDINELKK